MKYEFYDAIEHECSLLDDFVQCKYVLEVVKTLEPGHDARDRFDAVMVDRDGLMSFTFAPTDEDGAVIEDAPTITLSFEEIDTIGVY